MSEGGLAWAQFRFDTLACWSEADLCASSVNPACGSAARFINERYRAPDGIQNCIQYYNLTIISLSRYGTACQYLFYQENEMIIALKNPGDREDGPIDSGRSDAAVIKNFLPSALAPRGGVCIQSASMTPSHPGPRHLNRSLP